MDVSNLRSSYPKLLNYLADNGYGKAHKGWIKRCINLVLTDGASNEIESYEQLYWFEVEKCGYIKESTQKTFKSVLGTVWQFDKTGLSVFLSNSRLTLRQAVNASTPLK